MLPPKGGFFHEISGIELLSFVHTSDILCITHWNYERHTMIKNLTKQDASRTEIGESMDFKVLEFSKEDRRIALSHKATWSAEEEQRPAPVAAAPKKKAESKTKTIATINQQSEKSTLGDLEALSALKEKMSAAKATPSAEEPKSE